MYKIKFPSDKNGWLRVFRGRVSYINRWNDTYASSNPVFVTSNGNGGATVSGGGISVSTVQRAEYWLENENGEVEKIAQDLDAAPGHEIIAIWGDIDNYNFGGCIYWYNISTKNYYIGYLPERMLKKTVEVRFTILSRYVFPCVAFYFFVISSASSMLLENIKASLVVLAIGWGISMFAWNKSDRIRKLTFQLNEIRKQFESQTSSVQKKIVIPPPPPVIPPPLPEMRSTQADT